MLGKSLKVILNLANLFDSLTVSGTIWLKANLGWHGVYPGPLLKLRHVVSSFNHVQMVVVALISVFGLFLDYVLGFIKIV